MTDFSTNSAPVLDRDTIVVLGLAGAALLIYAGKVVNDPARREALVRLAEELEIPSAFRALGATVLEKVAQKLRAPGSISL
jgi:hypothetical protein